MERFLWICLAGATGTGVRYLVGAWTAARMARPAPYATLAVNVVGCFLMTLIAHVALRTSGMSTTLRLALTTGFLGGLTTYSAFDFELTGMVREGALTSAIVYLTAMVGGSFVAGLLGLAAGRLVANG